MRVPAFPTLMLRDFLPASAWPFEQIPENSALFFRGAGAILHAARTIGLTAEDEVLVPAYHCGVEVESIRQTGARIVFVPLTSHLELMPDALRTGVSERTKAVLLIHFFGLPQPVADVRELCDERGLVLIEDCAHALFSSAGGRLLGHAGDYSVFSFQKTLPVPDGGALVSRAAPSITPRFASPPLLTTVNGVVLRLPSGSGSNGGLLARMGRIARPPARAAVRLLRRWRKQDLLVSSSAAELDPSTACVGMSAAARHIAKHADADHIIVRRRRRYQQLVPALGSRDGIEIPFPELPDGACPLFLPLLVKERDDLRAFLQSRGIEPFVFGEIPHPLLPADSCPIARKWSRENLCLPTHQSLTDEMVSAVITGVKDWRRVSR